jgi:menaquinone-dependent protoporphyrinogen oxidase
MKINNKHPVETEMRSWLGVFMRGVGNMKSLIVYCSSHGTTEKAVGILSENLEGEVFTLDLNKESLKMDLDNFDNIIIGGSIHAGNIQRKVKRFIQEYYFELLTKEIGLFLCCMLKGDHAVEQFNKSFPVELRKNATALGLFGGELFFQK